MYKLLMLLMVVVLSSSWGCEEPPADGDGDGDADGDGDGDGDGDCGSDDECDDGVFCNGSERCNPSDEGADGRGCIPASSGPCSEDQECEEEGRTCVSQVECDADGDGHGIAECGGDDCDDGDANRYPGNTEVCDADNHDEDCDPRTYGVRDNDGDGEPDDRCCNFEESGEAYCGTDCDDVRAGVNPRVPEVCDELDNDCDGEVDEDVLNTFYADADGDGHGSLDPEATTIEACTQPVGFATSRGDCDDDNAEVHPGAVEECDEIDNNCDGAVDPGCECRDGNTIDCGIDTGECELGTLLCIDGAWSTCSGNVVPASEVCNGLDEDCNGVADNGVLNTYYRDSDGDGYGDPSDSTEACSAPDGYVPDHRDCDDTQSSIHPGATELCDGYDTDCSSGGGPVTNEDADGDGHATMDVDICSGGSPGMPQDDCDDTNDNVYPGQIRYFGTENCPDGTEWCDSLDCCGSTMSIYPSCSRVDVCTDEPEYDYNCDGVDEPKPSWDRECMRFSTTCYGSGIVYSGEPPACGDYINSLYECVYNSSFNRCDTQRVVSLAEPMPCR